MPMAINPIHPEQYADQAVLLTPADRKDFIELCQHYLCELYPRTPLERQVFQHLILAAWNIERTKRLESSQTDAKTLARIAAYRQNAELSFEESLNELKELQAREILRCLTPRVQLH